MAPTKCELVEADAIDATFRASSIDLVSSRLGGGVLAVSDEWFAEAINLINPKPPISGNGKVVFTGGWYDGWETRRHNKQEFDFVIFKLGTEICRNGGGFVHGIEVDTAFFNGNEAPAISVEGYSAPSPNTSEDADKKVVSWGHAAGAWQTILSKQPCGPTRRQGWKLKAPTACAYTHFRLCMYPDGGIARFRLFGRPSPPSALRQPNDVFDLAVAVNSGRCVGCSDEHFSSTNNLLLPGRGSDMSDGWETRRSREAGHTDWVIVRLGVAGKLQRVVVDTAHFRGNFPSKCQVFAIAWQDQAGEPSSSDDGWSDLTGLQDCAADTEHSFDCGEKFAGPATHVKLVIIPDGGVKRLRVFGTAVSG